MSFWGAVIKPGQRVTVSDSQGDLLHLSQACLSNPKGEGKTYLRVEHDKKELTLACLVKDTQEHCHLDLFFSVADVTVFHVEGKNDVHLTGYFEPTVREDSEDEAEPRAAQASKKQAEVQDTPAKAVKGGGDNPQRSASDAPPAKKAKVAAAVEEGPQRPADEAAYVAVLKKLLATKKKLTLAEINTVIVKPAGVPKLKNLVKKYKGLSIEDGVVTLAA
uniref:Nucleoplasmin-like domain-containing protein n=1 Tax=Oxyrrhis marina TaxID=2969 RepID=A0A7S3UPD0_OXYMA